MPTTIDFATEAYEEILAHAREGAPEEICGVLGGERDERPTGGGAAHAGNSKHEGGHGEDDHSPDRDAVNRVRSAHRAENVARSPRRTYLIDPEEQLEIMEAIEDRGQDVVGFYHSHPVGPPRPSPVDETRATWVGYSYAICLPRIPFVGSWRWSGETFSPEIVSLR